MNLVLIEPLSQVADEIAAAIVSPAEDLCGRFSVFVDAEQAVPERAGGHGHYLGTGIFSFCQNVIDADDKLSKCEIGIDLGTAFARGVERALVFYESFWKELSAQIKQRGADARGANIKTKDERTGQISDRSSLLNSEIRKKEKVKS